MFLCDIAEFSIKDRYNAYVEKQIEKDKKNAEEERRSPGRTFRKNLIYGTTLGAAAPVGVLATVAGLTGKLPKNAGKYILGKSAAAGVIGAGTSMLLRSPKDLKGEGGRNKKEKRLLKNVGRGALTGAGLAGLSALAMSPRNKQGLKALAQGGGIRGYTKKDFLGKTLNRIAAGAAVGSGTAYLGTKAYNRVKKDEN